MIYKGIIVKLPNKKEYKFSFTADYDINKREYKAVNDKDFKKLNKIISSKLKSTKIKRTTLGEVYIIIHSEDELGYFYLEKSNNDTVSFRDYVNLNIMLGNYCKRPIGNVIENYDFINNTSIKFVTRSGNSVIFNIAPL